ALRVAVARGLPAAKTRDNLGRWVRVSLQDAGDGGSRYRLDLFDQAQRKLDVLLLFFHRMGGPLYIKRRQREKQALRPIGAGPVAESNQNVAIGCRKGHVASLLARESRCTALP